jgi:hypothetical protein
MPSSFQFSKCKIRSNDSQSITKCSKEIPSAGGSTSSPQASGQAASPRSGMDLAIHTEHN